MRLAQVTLTVVDAMRANPQNKRKTAVALAAAELVPDGVTSVDHGDSLSYVFPGGRKMLVWHPEDIRDQIAGFYRGRASAHPVTFGLLVPTEVDVEAARASAQETEMAA